LTCVHFLFVSVNLNKKRCTPVRCEAFFWLEKHVITLIEFEFSPCHVTFLESTSLSVKSVSQPYGRVHT